MLTCVWYHFFHLLESVSEFSERIFIRLLFVGENVASEWSPHQTRRKAVDKEQGFLTGWRMVIMTVLLNSVMQGNVLLQPRVQRLWSLNAFVFVQAENRTHAVSSHCVSTKTFALIRMFYRGKKTYTNTHWWFSAAFQTPRWAVWLINGASTWQET